MHRNYYLYRQQLALLNTTIKHFSIGKCFTHRKDELVLSLFQEGQMDFLLRISVQIHLPYLLLYPGQNVRDPQIDFFPQIIGRQIINFDIIPFDKVVCLTLESYTLQMIFYGQNPNILLEDGNKQICATFKKKFIAPDKKKHPFYLDPDALDFQRLSEVARQNGEHTLLDFLNHHLGGFNSLLSRELCSRCSLDPGTKVHLLSPENLDLLFQKCALLMLEMRQPPVRIYLSEQQPAQLSLLNLSYLETDKECQVYDDVNTAWKQFVFFQQRQFQADHLSVRIKEIVQNRLAYLRRSLDSIEGIKQVELRKKEAELKGNLLLANLTKIPKGSKIIDLPNIFSTAAELVRIKLNPARSIQENARRYFEKYKDIEQKKMNISVRQDTFNQEYKYWQGLAEKLKQTTSLPQLEKIKNELLARGFIQDSESTAGQKEALDYSFHRLLLGKKWEIFIGKNAHNNELLTFKFAHKFDLWFHAQGVSGSHLVLRLGSKDSLPPPEIIEQAASAAAYFSAAKHSQLVPVNYTRVRYVRKIRNKPAGTVLISQEKTVFVKPQKFG